MRHYPSAEFAANGSSTSEGNNGVPTCILSFAFVIAPTRKWVNFEPKPMPDFGTLKTDQRTPSRRPSLSAVRPLATILIAMEYRDTKFYTKTMALFTKAFPYTTIRSPVSTLRRRRVCFQMRRVLHAYVHVSH